jgi:hypothetical protein
MVCRGGGGGGGGEGEGERGRERADFGFGAVDVGLVDGGGGTEIRPSLSLSSTMRRGACSVISTTNY